MQTFRPGAYALVLLVILSGLGIAWGAKTVASQTAERGDVVVQWERMQVDESDVVRVWIKNAGDKELHGSPKILILNENGGVQRSFAFGQFVIGLDPEESVYVDWALGSVHRCYYGMMDASGAPSDIRAPCIEPMMGDAAGDTVVVDDAPNRIMEPGCYGCYVPPRLTGTFVVVGIFGEHADAAVIELK